MEDADKRSCEARATARHLDQRGRDSRHAAAAFACDRDDAVTFRDIASLAGVDAPLIFQRFGTKRALFGRAIDAPDLAFTAFPSGS